jgi:pyridoxamine 5'-phosphate oxidase
VLFANPGAAMADHRRHHPAMSTPDPIERFREWFANARATEPDDPTAMALATVDGAGRPTVRMVLLKHFDAQGFVFYTNLDSPKSVHLRAQKRAALCWHWAKLERQVRAEGTVVPVTDHEADQYFATRPRLSQLGAWASRQSQPMAGRFELERAVAAVALRFAAGTVPRPPHWSGWRVVPDRIEFWQQRAFRHHDRELFERDEAGWRAQWLFP